MVALREIGEMNNSAQTFLTKAEQEQISAVVREVEKTTSGEIVPMIVGKSHEYPMATTLCSLILSLPLALLLTHLLGSYLWLGSQNMWLFLAFFALLGFGLWPIIARLPQLQYHFLNPREVEREVREGAIAAFYAEKLYKTADENGILLYISVLERKVWILADGGINSKIDPDTWKTVVGKLTTGIRQGQRCQAICSAIRETGDILRHHFPYQRGDSDELHNLIIR